MRSRLIALFIASLLGAHAVAAETHPANPYSRIALRNVFGLKPIPPAPKPAPPAPAVPAITLTGISTILGDKRVFLEIAPIPKPGAPPSPRSLMLKEGQQQDDIKILEIEPSAQLVKVLCSGTPLDLTFEKNGRKSTLQQTAVRTAFPIRPFPTAPAAFAGRRR